LSSLDQSLTEDRGEEPGVRPVDPRDPVAAAGEDQPGWPLRTLTLDGSASYDPLGQALIPTWSFVDLPPGSQAVLERADTLQPQFFADVAGTYTVELDVRTPDGRRDYSPDRVELHVVPAEELYIQLTWDAEADLDLHVRPADEPLWGPRDCSWCNLQPVWGNTSLDIDDPSLDIDSVDGFGPETVTLPVPGPGTLRAAVDYYGQRGHIRCKEDPCPPTVARVDVYVHGELAHTQTRELKEAGELWEVFALSWPSEQIQRIDTMGRTTQDGCR
jgi:hypothetical protein